MNRRNTGLVAGLWALAAAGALLLGLTAVGQIGSGLAGADPVRPLAADEIEAEIARHDRAAPQPAPRDPAPSQPAPRKPTTAVIPAGPAGTILARCEGGTAKVVSVNPAQGFEREDDDLGPGQVGFDGDDVDIRVALSCANDTPTGRVTTRTEDG